MGSMLRQYHFYRNILGSRLHVGVAIFVFASFLEGFGVITLVPLLLGRLGAEQQLSGQKEVVGLTGTEPIWLIIILIIFIFVTKGFVIFSAEYMNGVSRSIVIRKIRLMLIDRFTAIPLSQHRGLHKTKTLNTLTEQLTQSQYCFNAMITVFTQAVSTIIYVSLAVYASVYYGMASIAFGVIYVTAMRVINRRVADHAKKVSMESSILSLKFTEFTSGYKYLFLTKQVEKIKSQLLFSINSTFDSERRISFFGAVSQGCREPIIVSFLLTLVCLDLIVFDGNGSVIIPTIYLLYRAMNSASALQSGLISTKAYRGYFENVKNALAQHEVQRTAALTSSEFIGNDIRLDMNGILLENVSVADSSGRLIIENLNVLIPDGRLIVIVGPSGAGKTTLLELLSGSIFPSSGRIVARKSKPSADSPNCDYREVGYVPQESCFFFGTIQQNLTMDFGPIQPGKCYQDQGIARAAYLADCVDIIGRFDNDATISDWKSHLSGGEAQRLSVAREIYRNPSLLLMDEATSALDPESEKGVLLNLKKLVGPTTVVMVAHRKSVAEFADWIIVLNDGKVIQQGTPADLKMDQRGYYVTNFLNS